MIDFGVLSVIRQLICQEQIGKEHGLQGDNIYIMAPKTIPTAWPIVFLELEEAWGSSKSVSNNHSHARLVIKISVLSASDNGQEAIDIAKQISEMLDGRSLDLLNQMSAMCKLNSSVLDIKKVAKTPRKVEQFYEVWIGSQKVAQQQDNNLV